MKRNFSTLLHLFALLLVVPLLTSSCKDKDPDIIFDFYPLNIEIEVADKEGRDLLDANTPGNLLSQDVTATFLGKTFRMGERIDRPTPDVFRAYMPTFHGLLVGTNKNGRKALFFGELAGNSTFKSEELVLNWGNGWQKDVITISQKVHSKGNDIKVIRSFYLNGKRISRPIKIVKG
ncbi:MAG: hypothetical protein Q3998_01395 [Porphyromonas sp.]|nr:hypothetical protein [Porphyromonas sp.]